MPSAKVYALSADIAAAVTVSLLFFVSLLSGLGGFALIESRDTRDSLSIAFTFIGCALSAAYVALRYLRDKALDE